LIAAKSLCKSFEAINPVKDVSFTVEGGSSICILGRSGCGKTTLLKMMASILTPDGGYVLLDGKNVTRLRGAELTRLRSKIAYSFQEPLLLPYLNALENITSVLYPISSRPKSSIIEEARKTLSLLGLASRMNHYPSKLSVGEKKRVDLSRALVKNPSILIADEPFSNLDPETSGAVMRVLREFLRSGGTLAYSSTNPSERKFAHKTYRMS
jgi:polar amino acid transport system ATP-binding protein